MRGMRRRGAPGALEGGSADPDLFTHSRIAAQDRLVRSRQPCDDPASRAAYYRRGLQTLEVTVRIALAREAGPWRRS